MRPWHCHCSAGGDCDTQPDQIVQVLGVEAGRVAVTPALFCTTHFLQKPLDPLQVSGSVSSGVVLQEDSCIFGPC